MKPVTAQEMKMIDHMAIEQYGIPSLLLMENAGRGIADIVTKEAGSLSPHALNILVCCGKGNNGGDGLAAARHLKNRGFNVQILLLANPAKLKDDPAINFKIVTAMKIPVEIILETFETGSVKRHLHNADYIVDALFGVGLNKDITEPSLSLIEDINESGVKVIAVDLPSGLNADTGEVMGASIQAHVTATLGLPKQGLFEREGPFYSGQIEVVDIGIPKEIL